MALLTNDDYRQLRDKAYSLGYGKEELKTLAALPSEAQLKAAFQAIEDAILAAAPSIKASADTALGVTTSALLFKKLFRVWLLWRDAKGG